MKKSNIVLLIALSGVALAACHKQEPAADSGAKPQAAQLAPTVSPEAKLRAATGFAVQAPADLEGYTAFYNLGKLWSDIKHSKTIASLRSNALVTQVTGDPSFKQGFDQFSQNPEAAKWRAIVSDLLGREAFLELAPGSAGKLAAWVRLSDEMRFARMQNTLAGKKATGPENLVPTILPYLKNIELPPMVIGFKLTAQKAALAAELERGEASLPPGVELTKFDLNGNAFKSLVATVSKVAPAEQQEALKNWVAQTITDPKEADDVYQSLLARRIEIAYGFVGDYFVASIGTDHSHLKLAANFGESVLSHPEVASIATYADKPLVSFSWSGAPLMAISQRRLVLSPYYDRFKEQLSHSLSAADVQKLESDLKRLDAEANTAFTQEFTPMVGVMYRDHGLRGEAFGGVKPNGGTGSIKFGAVPSASTFLWVDSVSNPLVNAALRTWLEDMAATSYDTFQRVGLPLASPSVTAQFGMFQSMGLPKLTELYRITRDQFAKSLGSENAFALDLNGEIPALPMVPPQFHDGGKMFRIAYLSDVQNRALLGESWTSYLKLIRDIAQMIPQAAMLPNGIPDPGSETVDGVTLSYYQPPLPTGDLLPNVATTDKTFVMSTSRSYSLELTKAAAKAAAPAKPLLADFHMNFQPAFDFADKWMGLAAQYPDIFFHGDEAKAEQFKKAQPDLTAMLHSLRSIQGADMQIYEENGVRRVSSAIRWQGQ